jgi:hypothetical protein
MQCRTESKALTTSGWSATLGTAPEPIVPSGNIWGRNLDPVSGIICMRFKLSKFLWSRDHIHRRMQTVASLVVTTKPRTQG